MFLQDLISNTSVRGKKRIETGLTVRLLIPYLCNTIRPPILRRLRKRIRGESDPHHRAVAQSGMKELYGEANG